jgi:hypothetical protein
MKTNIDLKHEVEEEMTEEMERVFKAHLKVCIANKENAGETLKYQTELLEKTMITSPEEIYKKYAYMYGNKIDPCNSAGTGRI